MPSPSPLTAKGVQYREKAKVMRRRAFASASREGRLGLLVVAKAYEALAKGADNIAHLKRRGH